jgi:hypothetical protein
VLASAVAAAALLGGCRVDATVDAAVHGPGGTVTARFVLDREAAGVLGGVTPDAAQTSDLRRAGWAIGPVRKTAGGGAEVDVSKAFHRPEDLGVVIGELAGPGGPLRDFRLDWHRSLATASYRVRGRADLGAGSAAATGFANAPDLPARLRDAGVDPDQVEDVLAGRVAQGLHLRLVVALPGRTRAWTLGPGTPGAVDVSSSVVDVGRVLLLGVAVLGIVTVGLRLRRRPRQS